MNIVKLVSAQSDICCFWSSWRAWFSWFFDRGGGSMWSTEL